MDRQQQAIDTKINNYGLACEASKTAFNQELNRMKNLFESKTNETLKQIIETSTNALIKNKKECDELNVKMTTTYNTLVSTNAIAIKNSKILTTKVTNSTKDLASVDESMEIQKSTLQTIQATLNTIDERMRILTINVTPEYTTLIQDTSHSLVQSIIEQHCANPNTITILENLFDETIDNLADKKMGIIVITNRAN